MSSHTNISELEVLGATYPPSSFCGRLDTLGHTKGPWGIHYGQYRPGKFEEERLLQFGNTLFKEERLLQFGNMFGM